MKIRNGFVSNSSSSSFLIYGIQMEESELLENLSLKQTDNEEDAYEDIYEVLDEAFRKTGMVYVCPEGFDYWYIGRSWDEVKDNETGKQFKERVREEIKKVFKVEDKDFNTLSEAWFGG